MKYILKLLLIVCSVVFLLTLPIIASCQVYKEGYSQFLGYQLSDNKTKVSIPFEIHNNLIIIPLVLNGIIPLNFILDTGVRTAILMDKNISDILNLTYVRTITLIGAAGGPGVAAHVAPNVSLSMPGVIGAGQALLVLDDDYLQLDAALGTKVHGIIGYELFSRFVVEINYIENIVTLHEPKQFKPKRKFKAIPIKVEDTKPYITSFVVNKDNCKIESKLLIDTGASHSLLLHQESHEKIILPHKTIETSLGRGLGGDINGYVGRIPEVNISGFLIHSVITSFPEKDTYSDIIMSTQRQGSIGGGILNRFDIVFDYHKEMIYVKKNKDFKRKSYFNMSGIELKAEGQQLDKFIVIEVLKGSPGHQHNIKVGDEIIVANGMQKDNLSLIYLNNLFKSRTNKKINLRIKRNGEVLKKSFRLKKII
ncbi:MAG: aspartyl protease family protein [Bacteroidota bacterium]|nr:aspartyl protease family protein [Bacteroidota bacterium]